MLLSYRSSRLFAYAYSLVLPLMWLTCSSVSAAVGDMTASVPKVAYLQWLTDSADPMTEVNGDATDSFVPYVGGPVTQLQTPVNKKAYLGVMCNSLSGYEIILTANNAGATASGGNMVTAGGQPLSFTITLSKVTASITAGTTVSLALDLTGATPSISTVHAAESDLPMTAATPNVFEFDWGLPTISTVSDGLIMAGTYVGGVSATVVLK